MEFNYNPDGRLIVDPETKLRFNKLIQEVNQHPKALLLPLTLAQKAFPAAMQNLQFLKQIAILQKKIDDRRSALIESNPIETVGFAIRKQKHTTIQNTHLKRLLQQPKHPM